MCFYRKKSPEEEHFRYARMNTRKFPAARGAKRPPLISGHKKSPHFWGLLLLSRIRD
jgi:hypothetical protein